VQTTPRNKKEIGLLAFFVAMLLISTSAIGSRAVEPNAALSSSFDSIITFETGKTPLNELFVSTTGNNANNGSTEELALATIAKALDLATPGTAIRILPGTYTEHVWYYAGKRGTEENPIWIGGVPGRERPLLTKVLHMMRSSYIIFHDLNVVPDWRADPSQKIGINIDDLQNWTNMLTSHHFVFRNMYVSDCANVGL